MTGILLLFGLGLLLLFFEVFVPGGVLGVLGGLFLLAGCVVAFVEFGLGGGAAATAIALALVGLTLYFELFILPRTRLGQRLFLNAAVTSRSHEPQGPAAELVGKDGETLTMLAPSGFIQVAGRRYEAFSQSGLLPKGTAVKVVGLDNFRLIVTKS
jgi:membrane-bound ClpP family serine protease